MYTVDGVADILSRCDDHREGQEDHRGDAPGVHGDYDDDLNGDDDGGSLRRWSSGGSRTKSSKRSN